MSGQLITAVLSCVPHILNCRKYWSDIASFHHNDFLTNYIERNLHLPSLSFAHEILWNNKNDLVLLFSSRVSTTESIILSIASMNYF